jgi:hypothetical protein
MFGTKRRSALRRSEGAFESEEIEEIRIAKNEIGRQLVIFAEMLQFVAIRLSSCVVVLLEFLSGHASSRRSASSSERPSQ